MDQTEAASSPAEVDVFEGRAEIGYDEYIRSRQPVESKPAETADAPEETVAPTEADEAESESESETDEAQEPPQKPVPPAQKRILQLLAEKKELERKLAEAANKDVKPESSPAPAPNANAKPTIDQYDDWDKFNEALIEWHAEQKLEKFKQEQAQQAAQKVLQAQLDEARKRYDDADSVIFPTAKTLAEAKIPDGIKGVIADSDVYPDLCYVIGSDPEALDKFVALGSSNPRAALALVFEYERGIKADLAKAAEEPTSGKAPEKRQNPVPKPPSPVSGGSSRSFDVSDESLSTDDWARKRNAQLSKRG